MDRYTIISTADKMPLLHSAEIDNNEGYYCIYNDHLVAIKELQSELNNLVDLTGDMQDIIDEQSAHIERLRDAVFTVKVCGLSNVVENSKHLYEIIDKTPKQSLAKHDAKVIRKMCITLKENFRNNKDVHSYCNFPNELILEYADQMEKEYLDIPKFLRTGKD